MVRYRRSSDRPLSEVLADKRSFKKQSKRIKGQYHKIVLCDNSHIIIHKYCITRYAFFQFNVGNIFYESSYKFPDGIAEAIP